MKRGWVVALVLCSSALSRAEDWRATLTPVRAGSFPLLRSLHSTYRFGWQKLSAATAELDFSRTQSGVLQLDMTARTTGLVRSMWRMDTKQWALCESRTLRPVRARQTEVYSDQTLTTDLDFDPAGVARLRKSDPPDKNPPRTKRFKFPGVFDLQSALLFVRSQPLGKGEVIRMVVYPSTDPYLAEIEVLGRDTVEVAGKKHPAIRLGVKLRRINKALELEKHASFKRSTAWLSDDADRLLLKITAEIAVGSVWAELQSVSFKD